MKIYLSDQKNALKEHLKYFKESEVMNYYNTPLKVNIYTIDINPPTQADQTVFNLLFDYKIFPVNIMQYVAQWEEENREMMIGDTIAQQVYIPPALGFSHKVIFGVRVNEIINEPRRKGFSYEALEGHPENGISSFTLEQTNEKLIFKIQTCSIPGNYLAKFLNPVFSVPYRAYCAKKALKHVKRQLEKGITMNW